MAKSRQKYLSESEWEELTGNTGNSLTEEDLEALINEPLEVEVVVPEELSPSEVKERKRLERKV